MIELLDVSKKFRIWEDRSRDLKETTINFLKGKRRSFREIWALRDVSFRIGEGETVAFIGENGSGKSTLLKLLCSIYAPDEGRMTRNGKLSALLELGVGFHPDLTGEENVYLNGSMLGFDRREMDQRFDEIVSFSEIGDFIYSPIRTYSSGMVMRLGFSIAMCVDPDILLIDEVLAVGDEAFQQKCLNRLEEFKNAGKTIIIVSHAMEMVRKFCTRAILLHKGKIIIDGEPDEGIGAYHRLLTRERVGVRFEETEAPIEGRPSAEKETVPQEKGFDLSCRETGPVPPELPAMLPGEGVPFEGRLSGEGEVEEPVIPAPLPVAILEMRILNAGGGEQEEFGWGEPVRIRIVVETQAEDEPVLAVGIVRDDLSPVYGVSTRMDRARPSKVGNRLYGAVCEFPSLDLLPGKYVIRSHCSDSLGLTLFDTAEKSLTITGKTSEFGVCRLRHQWQAVDELPDDIPRKDKTQPG